MRNATLATATGLVLLLPALVCAGPGDPQGPIGPDDYFNGSNAYVPPLLNVNVSAPNGANNNNYVYFVAEVTDTSNNTSWFYGSTTTASYSHGVDLTFTEQNTSTGTYKISDVGYFLSPTQIPLDNLNYDESKYPPPGSPGSPFTSLSSLDTSLGSTSSADVVTPEPSSLVLLLCGGVGLVAVRLRRRKAVAA